MLQIDWGMAIVLCEKRNTSQQRRSRASRFFTLFDDSKICFILFRTKMARCSVALLALALACVGLVAAARSPKQLCADLSSAACADYDHCTTCFDTKTDKEVCLDSQDAAQLTPGACGSYDATRVGW